MKPTEEAQKQRALQLAEALDTEKTEEARLRAALLRAFVREVDDSSGEAAKLALERDRAAHRRVLMKEQLRGAIEGVPVLVRDAAVLPVPLHGHSGMGGPSLETRAQCVIDWLKGRGGPADVLASGICWLLAELEVASSAAERAQHAEVRARLTARQASLKVAMANRDCTVFIRLHTDVARRALAESERRAADHHGSAA